MSTRKLFMILDTETISPRQVFDLGYRVVDRQGNVYETGSYVVAETVATVEGVAAMMADSFTKTRAPRYLAALVAESGEFEVADFETIRAKVNEVVAHYKATVAAYNAGFDLDALNKTSRALLGSDFFEDAPDVLDLWAAALSTLCKTARYVRFVSEHGLVTEKGYPKSCAEAVYCYLTDNPDFEEAHTAAADCEIEAAILAACLRTKKRMSRKPVGMCLYNADWQAMVERFRSLA